MVKQHKHGDAMGWVAKSVARQKQHKHGGGVKKRKLSKKRYGQAAQAWRDMVKQHKHGDGVKRHNQEKILSSSTSMNMGSKRQARRDMVKKHQHGDAVKKHKQEKWRSLKSIQISR
jgi:hypothetical protein